MEGVIVIVLLLLAAPIILAIWLITRVIQSRERLDEVFKRLNRVEHELATLKERSSRQSVSPAVQQEAALEPIPAPAPEVEAPVTRPPISVPPPLPPVETISGPTPPPETPRINPVSEPQPKRLPTINWEEFMGVKMFAWVGGLALFLGLAFFVKYSFDNNLVPPELRVAIGFLAGLGLLVGGVLLSRRDYAVLSQTLCATGVVVLYAVTFACRSIYHFAFFGTVPTFLLMALITATAFMLAVRLNALVVAILGMLGGFLTPVLISTGVDNPLGLFGYIAILDAGLLLVALNRRWLFLAGLAALGTVLLQIGWAHHFFVREQYFVGNKILAAVAVLLGFNLLYLAASWWAKRRNEASLWVPLSGCALAAVALTFTAWFLSFAPLAQRPWLMFGFVFALTLIVTAIAHIYQRAAPVQPLAGMAAFGLLALWTANSLTNELLNAALVFYLLFAAMHTILPIIQQRKGRSAGPMWATQIFPPLALVLVLIPIFKLTDLSFVVWPFVLLVDLLAIVVAVLSASLLPVIAVLLLTLVATGALIFKIPEELTGLPTSFYLIGAFALFFVIAGVWLAGKLESLDLDEKEASTPIIPTRIAQQLPAFSAILPFLLLIMATLRLPLANPAPVFGLALLLVILVLGVTRLYALNLLPALALVSVFALECAWHFNRFDSSAAVQPLVWYLVFFVIFTLFPFVFRRRLGDGIIPWATSALAAPLQFFLIHRLVVAAYPNEIMGLLAAAFAIPPLLGLATILKTVSSDEPLRTAQLAWFGGVALFFITLIFPIQFERQWITIGWALEGAALLWLFHRVPHAGLRLTGVGLLIAAFTRLALNPAVFEYHTRSSTPILNWYLYAYGLVTVALFIGVRLTAPPRHKVVGNINVQAILASLGTGLAFLLVNIEIADFFSPAGSTLEFQFSGHFGRDMTYSIAWALFALVLLITGIVRKLPAARYGAIALLSVTLLKLFLHDLSRLGPLYRIGAFIGVAVIAMLASFAYQRFYAMANQKEHSDAPAQ